MEKPAYTEMLEELNKELEALPVCDWKGTKVVTSGIICDNPKLLAAFEENNVAIAADDVAHESRSFNTDVPEDEECPMMALAKQFANIDHDVLLYDPQSEKNRRGEFVADLVKKSGAQGLVLFMQQFCDPEEMEYPYLKKALDDAKIPHIKLGIDQQMRDFGQAQTAIQAFADVLEKMCIRDSSQDVLMLQLHAASLGLPYLPVRMMQGSGLVKYWGISEEQRKTMEGVDNLKCAEIENPFEPGEKLLAVPVPKLDCAIIHVPVSYTHLDVYKRQQLLP